MYIYQNEEKTEAIQVKASYSLGGINYFQNTQEARGIWLHITPVKIEYHTLDNGQKYSMITAQGFSGDKTLIKALSRKNAKAEEAIKEQVNALAEDIASAWLKHRSKEDGGSYDLNKIIEDLRSKNA